jgi:hypothetical protein
MKTGPGRNSFPALFGARLRQEAKRIALNAILSQLDMQVRSCGIACAAHFSNLLSLSY